MGVPLGVRQPELDGSDITVGHLWMQVVYFHGCWVGCDAHVVTGLVAFARCWWPWGTQESVEHSLVLVQGCCWSAQQSPAGDRGVICTSPAGFSSLCPLGHLMGHYEHQFSSSMDGCSDCFPWGSLLTPPDPGIFQARQSSSPLAPIPKSHEDTECGTGKGHY